MTFAQGPSILMPATALAEVRGKRRRLDEAQERALGIGVREHERSVDLGAVLEGHSANAPASARECAPRERSVRISTPRFRQADGHGLRDRPHPAHHVAVESLDLVLAAGEQVEEQPERGSRVVRSAVLPVDVVGEEQGLDLLRLVVPVEELAEAAGQERHHVGNLVGR